jgi:hypothetical protein
MTTSSQHVITSITELANLFAKYIDCGTHLTSIAEYANDRNLWRKSHSLFQQIRSSSNKACKDGDTTLILLHRFEESCAKSIYNLGRFDSPFDPESPFIVASSAFDLAHRLGISDSDIVSIISQDR